jgi:hypothetical protein
VAAYYLSVRGTANIATGYGLSEDGLWRQHSWLWNGKKVLETTVPRTIYFGVMLNDVEAARFVMAELPNLLPGLEELLASDRIHRQTDAAAEVARGQALPGNAGP